MSYLNNKIYICNDYLSTNLIVHALYSIADVCVVYYSNNLRIPSMHALMIIHDHGRPNPDSKAAETWGGYDIDRTIDDAWEFGQCVFFLPPH